MQKDIKDARSIIAETGADAVVIACDISDDWLKVVREIIEPMGVRLSRFSFSEMEICPGAGKTASKIKKGKHEESH